MFNFNPMLSNAVVSPALRPLTAGGATGIFNSGLPYDQVTEMVAGVLNQVLRSIGHSADLSALTSAVEIFLDAYGS